MPTPKKIAVISIYTSMGGGEYGLLHLMQNLDRSKFQPVLIVNEDGPLVERAKSIGIEVLYLEFCTVMLKHLIRPKIFWQNLKASFQLRKILRQNRIDIIHCSDVLSLLLLMPSLLTRRIPVLYNVIFFYESARAVLFNLLVPFGVRKIICLSRMVLDDLNNKTIGLEKKLSCVYWGVDTEKFHPRTIEEKVGLHKKYHLPLDKNIIGFVGRYDLWKGHHTFIDTAEILLAKRNDLIFLIVGGSMTENMIPAVAAYHKSVKDKIARIDKPSHFIVWDHSDEIPEIISVLDLFVCPSDAEPFGLVVLEAVASGIPTVISDTVGAVEILDKAESVLIAYHQDPESFSHCIETALQYNNLKTPSFNGNVMLMQKYSWLEYARQYENLYNSL
jgi:glycosyltransferase involved in cell wall biosynthesis